MAAWGHDDGYVAVAFGAKEQFADCLSEVAPPLGLQKSLRVPASPRPVNAAEGQKRDSLVR
jgi:hypothetical protein